VDALSQFGQRVQGIHEDALWLGVLVVLGLWLVATGMAYVADGGRSDD